MDKDYGVNVSFSLINHTNGTYDFGMSMNDSNDFHFDRKFENIVPTQEAFSMIVLNTIEQMTEEYAAAEQKKAEEKEQNKVSEEFMVKNDELNKVYEMYEKLLDKNRTLSEELESMRIDNEILRMRNDKLVNDSVKAKKKPVEGSDKIKGQFDKMSAYTSNKTKPAKKSSYEKILNQYADMIDQWEKYFQYRV